MARRRKRRTLKPRVPKRVKKKRRSAKTRGPQHPELIGLGLVALGAFLGSVIWAGWNGGYMGSWIGDGVYAVLGLAAIALPGVLVVIGALMVARSDLVDVPPFRTGLEVLTIGLLLVLRSSSGGHLGTAVGGPAQPLRRPRRAGPGLPPSRPRAPAQLPARRRAERRAQRARRRRARPDAHELRRRRDGCRNDLRPARDALRAAARAGHEGLEGRGAQGRQIGRAHV